MAALAFLLLVEDYWHRHAHKEISRVDKTTKINCVELYLMLYFSIWSDLVYNIWFMLRKGHIGKNLRDFIRKIILQTTSH